MSTPAEVAKWMYTEVKERTVLYQAEVVAQLQDRFGEEFTYYDNNGYCCIKKTVLKEFRALSEKDVVWERGNKSWRLRNPYDNPGKRQVD